MCSQIGNEERCTGLVHPYGHPGHPGRRSHKSLVIIAEASLVRLSPPASPFLKPQPRPRPLRISRANLLSGALGRPSAPTSVQLLCRLSSPIRPELRVLPQLLSRLGAVRPAVLQVGVHGPIGKAGPPAVIRLCHRAGLSPLGRSDPKRRDRPRGTAPSAAAPARRARPNTGTPAAAPSLWQTAISAHRHPGWTHNPGS
ncbi:hypothetical protein NDU88_004138 [Pleurodeles waltl]|uniref:Uncharacterized protein n=1 Tax=Pleurodeles waltl TaxID=8319 RepID=A0AAV7VFB9_PLEWA|nr:hypothetical protein NDU88_004138 [Pleurodeles waltl]